MAAQFYQELTEMSIQKKHEALERMEGLFEEKSKLSGEV